jgi:hypothetical protein
MNKTTYEKIKDHASLLHKVYSSGDYRNYELFDEPFKLAIEVLTWQQLDDQTLANKIGISHHTVKQVRQALGI